MAHAQTAPKQNTRPEAGTNGSGKHLLSLLLLAGGTVVVYGLIFLGFGSIKPWLTNGGFYAPCITMPTVLLVAFLYGGTVYRLLKPLERRIDSLGISEGRGHR
ncbi:MAG: hypothetical protein XD69_0226 [Clostridia bacterium 62_21]|nr:MAG: hypothetical protein XD69_0226 [Clostridia bacterium 62_21]HAG07071.1 hypothetical protein [Peptococcaceae bacterium]